MTRNLPRAVALALLASLVCSGCQSAHFALRPNAGDDGASALARRDAEFQPFAPAAVKKPTGMAANDSALPRALHDKKQSTPDLWNDDQPGPTADPDAVQLVQAELPVVEPSPIAPAPNVPVPQPEVQSEIKSGMTLLEFEQLALANNPAIQQAGALAMKSAALRDQVGRKPNPTVGYQGTQIADQGTDQHVVFIEQDFVLGKKLELGQRVLDQEIQVQLWEADAQRQRVLTDVRTSFYQALAAQVRWDLTANFEQVATKGVDTATQRRDVGEASDIEILQAEIQLNEVQLIQQRARIEWSAAWSELIAVAGVPGLVEMPLSGTLRVPSTRIDWNARYLELEACSPEIRAACMRVAKSQALLDRQRVQPVPNLVTQFATGYDNGTQSGMINLQAGVPLPIFNDNSGNVSAAYAEYCAATQNLQRLKLSLKQRLADVSRQYDSAAISVERYETVILPKAEQTLRLSEQAYATQGSVDFLQVLVARRTFLDSNLSYNQSLEELAAARVLADGMLLSGGLDPAADDTSDDGLRGQALSGQ